MNLDTVRKTDTSKIDDLSTSDLRKFVKICEGGIKEEAKKNFSLELAEFQCKGMIAWTAIREREQNNKEESLLEQAEKLKSHPDKTVRRLVRSVLSYLNKK